MDRRNFIINSGLTTAGIGLGLNAMGNSWQKTKGDPFVGMQLGSHSLYDEGIDQCLDLMQDTSEVNAIFLYATIYQGYSKERKLSFLATDHGTPPIDPNKRNLPLVWFKPHEKYYSDTFLRHWSPSPSNEFFGKDVFADTFKPAERRGMKVYARMLEGWKPFLNDTIVGYSRIVTTDVYGQKTHLPCWNHPAYRAWWLATVRDLFENNRIAGLKWGSERCGPLSELFSQPPWRTTDPNCFCEHCVARGAKSNIDAERAKEGFKKLVRIKRDFVENRTSPIDGAFISILRIFSEYPEVLAWDRLWYESMESLAKEMYTTIKSINPNAEFGRHIWHMISFDPFYRSAVDYSSMAEYSDWLKPVVYHETASERFKRYTLNSMTNSFLSDLPFDFAGEFLYRVLGYDPVMMPKASDLDIDSFPADYVVKETLRCVKGVESRTKVYPGIGFDIPGQLRASDPEVLYNSVVGAFKAGADGLLVSREYDEMRLPGLKAVGKAVRDSS